MSVLWQNAPNACAEASFCQAYDGHMNLILSDVEETIMIVDQVDGAPEGHATVNVSSHFCYKGMYLVIEHCPSTQGREAENGNAFRPGRRCDPGEHIRINAVGIPSRVL